MSSVLRVRIVAGLVILLTLWPLRAEGQHRAAVLIIFGDDPSYRFGCRAGTARTLAIAETMPACPSSSV
jgi:hypothetical protein